MWSNGDGLWILGLVGLDLFSPFPLAHLSPRAPLRLASPIIFPPPFLFLFWFPLFCVRKEVELLDSRGILTWPLAGGALLESTTSLLLRTD